MLSFSHMAKLINELSVFLPTYNEESNIRLVASKTKTILDKVADKWELLIVNDGSSDSTAVVAEDLEKTDSRIRLINHDKNLGYGAALATGFYNARYSWVSFIDSDGQFDFNEIVNFIEKQKNTNADLVIGYYKSRKVSFSKVATSKLWEVLVFLLPLSLLPFIISKTKSSGQQEFGEPLHNSQNLQEFFFSFHILYIF